MITQQGAGAIVSQEDGRVLLVRVKRLKMERWELPSALRKGEESLLMTVYRCVEEESRHRYRIRIGRPVCMALNRSGELGRSYFGIFFECTAEIVPEPGGAKPKQIEDLPDEARQSTIGVQFIDWRTLDPREMHPQHRNILLQWSSTEGASGGLFAVESDADEERRYYFGEHERGGASPPHSTLVESVRYNPPPASEIELRWIHVSDIHFGSTSQKSAAEQELVLERLLQDVDGECARLEADYIFVTGDVAFSGRRDEYAHSLNWLRRLADKAKVPSDRIWLVPGNHDVRRDLIEGNGELKKLHMDARAQAVVFDNYFSNPVTVQLLASKLQDYAEWVGRNFAHIRDPLDWSTTLTTRRGRHIDLAGLCTVWVSDGLDGGGPNQSVGSWTNNMFVSRDRSRSLLNHGGDQSLPTLLLTHHPRSWLCVQSDAWLNMALSHKMVVHLCGHVHEDSGGIRFAAGAEGCFSSIAAGAVHGGDNLRHGYAWGQLRFETSTNSWHLGWAPRSWTRSGQFTADKTNYPSLDESGYHWELLTRRVPPSSGRVANPSAR